MDLFLDNGKVHSKLIQINLPVPGTFPHTSPPNLNLSMAAVPSKNNTYYSPLPPPPPQNYILLPLYNTSPNKPYRPFIYFTSFILLLISIYLLYPSDPSLTVVRTTLNSISLHTKPSLSLDINLNITVKVRNRDFFRFEYEDVVVKFGYRNRELGKAKSSGGSVRMRGSSYVEAELKLDGIEVLHDVFYLLKDLAKGVVGFDTVTLVNGKVGVLFFEVPIKAKVSCDVLVSIDNQTITHQDCY